MIRRINRKQKLILLAIAKYKFISYKQVVRLGIEKNLNKCSGLFAPLRDSSRPLVRKIQHRGFGMPCKHYLTPKGKNILLELCDDLKEEQIKLPKGVITTDTKDQRHRTLTIDIEIDLYLACEVVEGMRVIFSDRYFDKVGNNRISKNLKSKTGIYFNDTQSVKADMVFKMQTTTQEELYFMELELNKDTQKSVNTAIEYAQAIARRSANHKYNFPRGFRVIWYFEHESIMRCVMERLDQNPIFQNLKEYYLFKHIGQIGDDIFDNWLNIEGKKRRLFYTV